MVYTAGNPSLVFDCIYNTTLKARLFSDPEVKIFLVGAFPWFSIMQVVTTLIAKYRA